MANYRKLRIFHCYNIFRQPGLCKNQTHENRSIRNISDIAVQGRLSENYLMQKIIARNILDMKYLWFTVASSPFLSPVAVIAALALSAVRSLIRGATAAARVGGTARRKTRLFVQVNTISYVCQLGAMLLEGGRERESMSLLRLRTRLKSGCDYPYKFTFWPCHPYFILQFYIVLYLLLLCSYSGTYS